MIHRFWLAALGLQGDYRATHVNAGDIAAYFAHRRDDPLWVGCNVTMPHKEAVIPFLSSLDERAETLRAVNTIVRAADGGLHGYNTDVDGVAEPLRKYPKASYPNHVATYVQIIGAGGAARAAGLGALLAGYGDFDIFNRTPARGDALAALVGAPFSKGHPLEMLGPIRNLEDGVGNQRYSHVLINATSMGMNGVNPVPIRLADYYPDTLVFDMVYLPLETTLLREARRLGLRTIDGLEMLVGQAAVAFARFFGVAPPRDRDAELRGLLVAALVA